MRATLRKLGFGAIALGAVACSAQVDRPPPSAGPDRQAAAGERAAPGTHRGTGTATRSGTRPATRPATRLVDRPVERTADRRARRPDYQAHVAALRKKLPHDGFHIVIQPPFVVVGDESKRTVKARARNTVKWATDLLKKAYFPKDPDHIIDVWLFKDPPSYRKHVYQLFKQVPHTPFGWYSPRHRALIMDISTGGGTLVHEIVHPFVAANFPDCPAWFNEGLGSLYEQCRERHGKIMGLTNWRLAGLQKAIRGQEVPTFRSMTATTDHQFYTPDRGTNYAQARYLCYYLQEKGLLRKYYKAFHAARKQDPTGYRTLQKVLGRQDMKAFQKEWEQYVLKLRYSG
ncbi:MAG: hypothetical protein ACYTGW_20160 [Planctomycetota bacterium]|jgi:hypothetical protein